MIAILLFNPQIKFASIRVNDRKGLMIRDLLIRLWPLNLLYAPVSLDSKLPIANADTSEQYFLFWTVYSRKLGQSQCVNILAIFY